LREAARHIVRTNDFGPIARGLRRIEMTEDLPRLAENPFESAIFPLRAAPGSGIACANLGMEFCGKAVCFVRPSFVKMRDASRFDPHLDLN
jgi:hypothetical protein